MTPPQLRASDADRERVVRALERHTAAGRLSLDEYSGRVDRVLAARTLGDLALVVADLPALPEDPAAGRSGQGSGGQGSGGNQLVIAFLIAFAALVLIGGLVLAFR